MTDRLATADEAGVEALEHPIGKRDEEGEWAVKDRRRGELIDKKYTVGLDLEEQQELDQLQKEMERRLDAIAPISFEVVEALEEAIRVIKADQNEEQSKSRKP